VNFQLNKEKFAGDCSEFQNEKKYNHVEKESTQSFNFLYDVIDLVAVEEKIGASLLYVAQVH